MKDRVITINLSLGLIGALLGITASTLVILSLIRPDLLKNIIERLFPNLESR